MAHGVKNNPKKELIPPDGLTFYPAYCYKASPTHFAWVKLSAVNVHHLTRRSGYEGILNTSTRYNKSYECKWLTPLHRTKYILLQKPPYPVYLSGGCDRLS